MNYRKSQLNRCSRSSRLPGEILQLPHSLGAFQHFQHWRCYRRCCSTNRILLWRTEAAETIATPARDVKWSGFPGGGCHQLSQRRIARGKLPTQKQTLFKFHELIVWVMFLCITGNWTGWRMAEVLYYVGNKSNTKLMRLIDYIIT